MCKREPERSEGLGAKLPELLSFFWHSLERNLELTRHCSLLIVYFRPSDTACTAPLASVQYLGIFRAAQRSITAGAGKPNGLKTVI